jgi:hypothetical protein
MAAGEIHIGDVGTVLTFTVKNQAGVVVNLSTATQHDLIFRKPDGTVLSKTGAFVTDGSDGKIKYVTVAGFLDLAGIWKVQADIDYATTKWKSDIGEFRVYANLA